MSADIELTLGDSVVTVSTGRIARQASGSVVVRHRGSFVLGTVTCNHQPNDASFLPLTVDYREKMSSRGRIPGNFFRRETRSSEHETLMSRMIDRSLRPLFPMGFNKDTVVTVTVFSADDSSDLIGLGILAASAALHISDVPFSGPILGGCVTYSAGQTRVCPDPSSASNPEFDLVVSLSPNGLVMLEGASDQGSEELLVDVLESCAAILKPAFNVLDTWREEVGKKKVAFDLPPPTEALHTAVDAVMQSSLNQILSLTEKSDRDDAFAALKLRARNALPDEDSNSVTKLVSQAIKAGARERALSGNRADGRDLTTVRAIDCEVGLLQNSHGSALFTRGETQAIVSATLGSPREGQDIETLDGLHKRGFILHYNFPGYAVGEARRPSGPGRREIGHGSLARRALNAVMPDSNAWPYTTRVLSDITESNGSSSMASVCGGCLALLSAGVPLIAPVAGVAMGLVTEGDKSVILTDIIGEEDYLGDMDFKVAGTLRGITAVQLDNKLGSLPTSLLKTALEHARIARLHILECMQPAIESLGQERFKNQGRHVSFQINPARIGAVVGTGGKNIQHLQEITKTRIEIGRDGNVLILGSDTESVQIARRKIEAVTADLKRDGLYVGTVSSLKDFGLFVRISSHEGLVHVSEISREKPLSAYSAGDSLLVKVLGADQRGRLKLSQKAAKGSTMDQALNAS
jgi:polyribonucleotide nucleotidyltransferase